MKKPDDSDNYILIDNIYEDNSINYMNNNIYERILLLDYDKYWNDIYKSYKNDEDIWNQFQMDIIRCKYYINYCPINNPIKIKQYLYSLFDYQTVNDILMISTQVLMGTPYEIISNSINKFDWYFSEIGIRDSLDKQMSINLFIDYNKINISAKKKMRIFKFDENIVDNTLYYVDIHFNIDMINKIVLLKLLFNKL